MNLFNSYIEPIKEFFLYHEYQDPQIKSAMIDLDKNCNASDVKIATYSQELFISILYKSLETKDNDLSLKRVEKLLRCVKDLDLCEIEKSHIKQTAKLPSVFRVLPQHYFFGKTYENNNLECAKLLIQYGLQSFSDEDFEKAEFNIVVDSIFYKEPKKGSRNYYDPIETTAKMSEINKFVDKAKKKLVEEIENKTKLLIKANLFDTKSLININKIPIEVIRYICNRYLISTNIALHTEPKII